MQVLEDDQHRPVPRERFQQTAGGPEDLRGGRPALAAGAESAVKLLGDGRRVRLPGQEVLDPLRRVVPAARLADHLPQRPERDAFAVREAPAGENVRLAAEPSGELLDQPRLPESGLADHGDGHGHPLTGGPGVRRLEATYLFDAAHQRRIETDSQGTQAGLCGPQEEPIGSGAVGLDGSGGELLSLVADEDLARRGGLREHHRPDSHIPGESQRTRPSDQGLTRRQAEAVNQAGAILARQDARLGGERLSRLQAGPRRPEGVVLVQGSDTEHAHQVLAIAGRQLSAVPLEHGCQARDHVLVHDAMGLRVQRHTRAGR